MAWLFSPILPSVLVSLLLECHSCWSNCSHRESPRPYLLEKSEQSRVCTSGAKDHLGCWSHIPVIDTYPETDYLSAKRLALSGTGGWHLAMLRTPRTLQGGCDDGR